MQSLTNRCSLLLIGLIAFLSINAFIINYFVYQFPGNTYFPENTPLLIIIIALLYWGLVLTFGKNTRISHSGKEFFYFFCVMLVIAFATNAIQLTPFPTIDRYIIHFESHLGINLTAILEWINRHQQLKTFLYIIYDTLPYQMSILPLLMILTGRFSLLKEYYFLLLFTTLVGFSFYYLFPTTAPASILQQNLFLPEQIATGLKFFQIHHHIVPTTIDGGLIALPSFHTIWALLCVYLLKEWFFARLILLMINSILIISCVLLGWHYVTDIIAGIFLTGSAYYCLTLCKKTNTGLSR